MSQKPSSLISLRLFNSQLTAVISISLVLFLLGIVSLLFFVAKDLSVYIKENIGFSIVLNNDLQESEMVRIQKRLVTMPEIKEAILISKEDALKSLIDELGEDPNEFLGYNPLSASIEVKMHSDFANNESISILENKIRQYRGVEDVIYRKDLIQAVNENVTRIGIILSILAFVLTIISYTLINNTIRLVIYSRRFLIHTMKLVGANRGFIRRPFIIKNIVSGIIASIIAILLLLGAIYYISGQIPNFFSLLQMESLLLVFGVIFVAGLLITLSSAFFSVNKYLNMNNDNLYYI
ncbi:MAG: permease-like cell division protein FtsX [Bacteroidales bacterium]|nr:permease-like cell division protein FtsX [Bacteroidales bacterium]